MKKMLTFMSIYLASLLLTGCISIPLGDGGKLEVSKDGINVDLGEGNELEIEEVESAEEEEIEKEDEVIDEDVAEEEGKDEGKSEATTKGSTSCNDLIEDPKGNDRLVKALAKLAPPNFPLSDCTLMGTTKEGYHGGSYEAVTVDANFKVEGYWADVYDLYVDYMEEAGFGPLAKKEDAQAQYASLSGKTADYDLSLSFTQRDAKDGTEYVVIEFGLYHYDTPREE